MFARCLSSLQAERVSASSQLKGPSTTKYTGDKKEFIEHIRKVTKFSGCSIGSALIGKTSGKQARLLMLLVPFSQIMIFQFCITNQT